MAKAKAFPIFSSFSGSLERNDRTVNKESGLNLIMYPHKDYTILSIKSQKTRTATPKQIRQRYKYSCCDGQWRNMEDDTYNILYEEYLLLSQLERTKYTTLYTYFMSKCLKEAAGFSLFKREEFNLNDIQFSNIVMDEKFDYFTEIPYIKISVELFDYREKLQGWQLIKSEAFDT